MIGKATLPGSIVKQPKRLARVPGADPEEPDESSASRHRCKSAAVIATVALIISCAVGFIAGGSTTTRMSPTTADTTHPPTSAAHPPAHTASSTSRPPTSAAHPPKRGASSTSRPPTGTASTTSAVRLYRALVGIAIRRGPDVGSDKTGWSVRAGNVFEVTEEMQGVGGQRYLKLKNGDGWVFTQGVSGAWLGKPIVEPAKAVHCPDFVLVSGVPQEQSIRNGLFRKIGVIKEDGQIRNGGRPTFKKDRPKQFLFYNTHLKSWRIGNQPEAGQDGSSDGVISQDWQGAACPNNASGWHCWKKGRGWRPSSSITVEAASKDRIPSKAP